MKLLAVVLLLLPLSGCLAAVVTDFTASCPQFFANPNGVVSPPTRFPGAQYRQICQTLNGVVEFATFYDTTNRIPVYSAYEFAGLMGCNRLDKWYIEPQLDNPQQGGNMEFPSDVKPRAGQNQARNGDYTNSGFDKGHLAPVFHVNSQSCADATFTLTNAAPQFSSFNKQWFHHAEKPMATFLSTNCAGMRAYVVTGVVPGNTYMNNRVRVPSHYWTAYCCIDQNNVAKHSGGFIGENVAIVINLPKQMSRVDLENELRIVYGPAFTLFGGQC